MARSLLILTLTVIIAGLGVSCASAQDDGDLRLSRVSYMQIKPGQLAAFEAAWAKQIEHRQEHGFRWRERVAINENNVVRINTRLNEGWADMETMREWFQNTPRANSGMGEAVEFLGTEITQGLPEMSYFPENPRVPFGEFNFSHELRIYPGRGQGFREFMEAVRDAFQEADSGQPRFVGRHVVGPGGFSVTVGYPAKDVLDWYTSRDEIQAILGSVQRDGSPNNTRRIQRENWTWRRDLAFVPSN